MTGKRKGQRLDAPLLMMTPLVDQMPNSDEQLRRVIAKAVGERWAAETLARIEQELDGGTAMSANPAKRRRRSRATGPHSSRPSARR